MADSKRNNPVINGFKVCKICNENKELTTAFQFHTNSGYYSGTCLDCSNLKRRLSRPVTNGIRIDSVFIRQKECLNCKIVKNATEFSKKRSTSIFYNVCKLCVEKENQSKKQERLNKGYLPSDSIRECIICKNEKPISDFSFSKNIGYYSSYCKPCDVKRKQAYVKRLSPEEYEDLKRRTRQYGLENKPKYLLSSYNKFDFNKGLENDLTFEFIQEKLLEPCSYCFYPSTGLDRIDNSLGHLQSNCVPCCRDCNTARMNNFSSEEMKIIGKAIQEVKNNRLN